ncbi:MAG: NERD domain-containing protein [Oscillospiraceae bacterium]|nr:NERD domain-containing protein [Oscillospiraceae bacterium]
MDEKTIQLLLTIGGAVVAVVVLLIALSLLRTALLRKKGVLTQNKVSALLRKFAGIRSFKVINGLKLKNGDEVVTIDHVLIGFFGMILLTDVNAIGSVYGDYKDEQWMSIVLDNDNQEKSKALFNNPVKTMEKCTEAMRKLLAANNLYKIGTEAYVVFGERKVQLANMKKKNGMPLLTFPQLKRLLEKDKYSADGPVDVKEIHDLLMANAAE